MKNVLILVFTLLVSFNYADAPVDTPVAEKAPSEADSSLVLETKPSSIEVYESETSFDSSEGIEEVVVTASKREEVLREAPVAITAITNSTIKDLNITNLSDIQSMSPNVHIITTPSNNTSSTIAIRGNATINPAITWENAVALYVDGVYIGKTQGSLFDMVDLERIEVLRGPQGTLYGRNALAGAINFISKRPSGDGASLDLTIGNYGLRSSKFSYDFALGSNLFSKITLLDKKRDGYTKVGPSPYGLGSVPTVVGAGTPSVTELDTVDLRAARFALTYEGDFFNIDFAFDNSEQNNTPPFGHLTRLIPNWSTAFGVGEVAPGVVLWPLENFVVDGRQKSASIDAPTEERSDIEGASLTLTFDTPLGEVKAIYSDRKLKWFDYLDLDGSPFPIFHTSRETDYSSESFEIQLVGSRGIVDYVFGYFAFEDEAYTNNPQYPFGQDNPEGQEYSGDTDASAFYGQLDINVTDRTKLTIGLRETTEEKDGYKAYKGSAYAPFGGVSASSSAEFDNTSTTFILSHQLTDTTNLYAKLAEGFKGGGFNAEEAVNFATFSLANGFKPYAPETIESTEFGLKGLYFDNRLALNIAYFMNEHEDMQVAYFTAAAAAASEILNASAEIDGLEIELQAYLSDTSRINVNFGLLDIGGYTENALATDGFALQAFPYSPESSVYFSYEKDFEDFTLRIDHERISEHYAFPYNSRDPRFEHSYHDGRNVTNLRVIMAPQENIDLVLWIKNLSDHEYSYTNIPFGPSFGNLNLTWFAPPRTLGFDFRYRF